MTDNTEAIRREMIANDQPAADLAQTKQVWTTDELRRDFIVHSFLAPFVTVTRLSDGKVGSLEFNHFPRFYFNFQED